MQPIPDTGGGLSGFMAHGLWLVYRCFPASGTWDWLLLIVLLAAAVQALILPVVHKTLALQARTSRAGIAHTIAGWYALWEASWLWLLVWFFHTPAGQSFLEGRQWFGPASPTEVSRGLFWLSGILHFAVAVVWTTAAELMDAWQKTCGAGYLAVLTISFAHALYWNWSVASLVLMLTFTVTIGCFALIRHAAFPRNS